MDRFMLKDAWPNFYSVRSLFREFSGHFTANSRYQDDDAETASIDLSDLSRPDVEEAFRYLTTPYTDLSIFEVEKWYAYLSEKFGRYHIPILDPLQSGRWLRAHDRENRLVAPSYSPPLVETIEFPVGEDLPPVSIPRWYLGRMTTIVDLRQIYPDLTVEEVVAASVGQIPPAVREYLSEFLSVLAGTFGGRHNHQAPMWSMGARAVAEHLGLNLPKGVAYHVIASTDEDLEGWQCLDHYRLAEWTVVPVDGSTSRHFLRSLRVRYAPEVDWSIEVPSEVIPASLIDQHPRLEPFLASLSANEIFILAARSLAVVRQMGLGIDLLREGT